MESFLEMLGLLFFMFLVLGACVEVIIEVFRGILEKFGVNWAESKVSLEEALELASEFACEEKDLHTKLQAVKSAAAQLKTQAAEKILTLERIKNNLGGTGIKMDEIAAEINEVAANVKDDLKASERTRMFILRTIAALVGCILTWQSDFYVFNILAKSQAAEQWRDVLQGLQNEWINVIVGGFAAAAGSSYWHDQLDKIRNLKGVYAEMK